MIVVDPWLTPVTETSAEQRAAQALYTLVSDMLAAEQARQRQTAEEPPPEARRTERREFRCLQLIAEYDGGRMPSQSEFRPEVCHDLSPSGFSYWRSERCLSPRLIVALGEVPFLFCEAEIVHQVWDPTQAGGRWRIGGRFLRRIT